MPYRLRIILSIILALYLAAATAMTMLHDGKRDMCRGIVINVAPGDSLACKGAPFVTVAELGRELDSLPARAKGMYLSSISPQDIRNRLMSIDKIEDVDVLTLTDGTIHINVTPLQPVMRIFDGDGSYYVNRTGKRMKASARYKADVPIIAGRFPLCDTVFTPLSLLPLVDYITSHKPWDSYITMIRVDSPRDIVLIPAINDHIINFGTPDNYEDKFNRLQQFYTQVLPVKGWDMYDMVSLKWAGQVVATRRKKSELTPNEIVPEEEENVDTGTMLAGDNVAPGQAIPGRKAHNEKAIPGSRPTEKNDTTKKKS